MEYEQHEIGKAYPPLKPEEYGALKAALKSEATKPIVYLFEDKVLDGWHSYKACLQLGIKPIFETARTDTAAQFVRERHEGRRNITIGQLAKIGRGLCNGLHGANQYKEKKRRGTTNPSYSTITINDAARQVGVSPTLIKQVGYIEEHGDIELNNALAEGKITVYTAKSIAKLPKDQQSAALEKAKAKKANKAKGGGNAAPSTNGVKPTKRIVQKLTEEQLARDKVCLEQINAPSTFPTNAPIPHSDNYDEDGLRLAINWLREHEDKIATFSEKDLYEMLLRTNRIQAYQVNWSRQARPNGELDQRVLDWAGDLWRRQQRQHERIDMLKAARKHHVVDKPAIDSGRKPFGVRFKRFWKRIEDFLPVFTEDERGKLAKAFKKELINFFSESPTEETGTAEGVAVRDVQLVDS